MTEKVWIKHKNGIALVRIPDPLTKSWIKGLPDEQLWGVYEFFVSVDDFLSHGSSPNLNRRLLRVRDELERRGIL